MTRAVGWFWAEEDLPGYDLAWAIARARERVPIPATVTAAPRWFWTAEDPPPAPEWLLFVHELSPPLWLGARGSFHALPHTAPSALQRDQRPPKTPAVETLKRPVRIAPYRLAPRPDARAGASDLPRASPRDRSPPEQRAEA